VIRSGLIPQLSNTGPKTGLAKADLLSAINPLAEATGNELMDKGESISIAVPFKGRKNRRNKRGFSQNNLFLIKN